MVKFFEPYPTFGTKNNRLPPSKQEESPYYWWWAYLRRNKEYLACCEKGGRGKLAKLYADFGDVRGEEFRLWWRMKALELFAEQTSAYKFKELASKEELPEKWNKDEFMYLQVPLTYDKKSLKKYFNELLTERGRKKGRPSQTSRKTTAKYSMNGTYTIGNLRICLQVYDRYMETRSGVNKLKLWEIGVEMGLLDKDAMPNSKDTHYETVAKRNCLAATVSRYVKQAKARIGNAALGIFPVV